MLATYASEPAATGNDDTSVFHALSAGKTGHPPSDPFSTIAGEPAVGGCATVAHALSADTRITTDTSTIRRTSGHRRARAAFLNRGRSRRGDGRRLQ